LYYQTEHLSAQHIEQFIYQHYVNKSVVLLLPFRAVTIVGVDLVPFTYLENDVIVNIFNQHGIQLNHLHLPGIFVSLYDKVITVPMEVLYYVE